MGGRLDHSLKVFSVCIKFHNLDVDHGDHRIILLQKGKMARAILLPVQQDKVSLKPKSLKSKVRSSLRDKLCDTLQEQGYARLPLTARGLDT